MSTIRFYNTPAKQVQDFTPQDDKKVSIYTCGPTVYSTPHIGNFVAYLRWDILVRMLSASGFEVTRVMNLTDVGHLASDADDGEDKMLKGAKREGISMWDVATRYTKEFMDGFAQLNMVQPTHITKATDFIAEQIALIKTLEAKHYTYVINDGVYFDTAKFPRYADFAHLDLANIKAGARVDYNSEKRNHSDFALWKFDTTGERTEMVWDSPWGKGFPGWHLECSAMIKAKLGDTIDIHTGGIDHIPVHHTNEIAQSEAANGVTLANYWIHGAHLLADGKKMSKSLGNSYTLQQLYDEGYSAMDARMFFIQSHYQTEGNFTWENLEAAANRLQKWRSVAALRWQLRDDDHLHDQASTDELIVEMLQTQNDVLLALQNDLDTPLALRAIDELFAKLENTPLTEQHEAALARLFVFIDETLGLQLLSSTPDISNEQKELIEQRRQARSNKDWQRADELRKELSEAGIGVRDTAAQTIWSYE